jgi:hypothetical protein
MYWNYACTCTYWKPACVCTYPKLFMFLHVSAHIKSWSGICICLLLLRDLCVSAFIGLYRELSVCLHVARELSICWHVSRAERVSSFSSLCWELCVCRLHVSRLLAGFESWACIFMRWACVVSRAQRLLACFESWACIFIQLPVSSAECVPACASRAERVCECICIYWGLSVCLYLFARIKSRACVNVSAHIEGWACVSICFLATRVERVWMYLHIFRAERVSLFVCMHQEWSSCVHVSARIKSRACICVRLRFWEPGMS